MKRIAVCALASYLVYCYQASGQVGMISTAGQESQYPRTTLGQKVHLVENYGKLPLSFEANTGQMDKSVKFVSRGKGYGLYLMDKDAVLALNKGGCDGLPAAGVEQTASSVRRPGLGRREVACAHQTPVVRMRLEGSKGVTAPVGEEQLTGTANYFIGNDPAKWRTDVPTYARVRYRGVYPGVDLVYYGNQRQLEYDFVVSPGTDPKSIRLQFSGPKGLRLGADGDLVLTAAGGAMAFRKPVVYQVTNGQRKAVVGGFTLLARQTVGFRLGSYDHGEPLVIDPVLEYSTYLGGSSSDAANAIVADAEGNVYITGSADSANFPVSSGAFQTTNKKVGGGSNAFVAKLNPTGTALIYSTYLGGSGSDSAFGLAVDGSGDAYIAGSTSSKDFPITKGAFQTTGVAAGFVSKLNSTGNALVYSTYFGSSPSALAVDSAGNTYIAGNTLSSNLPVTAGAFQTTNHGESGTLTSATNAFVAKLNPIGSALVYSTYLGGSGAFGFSTSPFGPCCAYGDGATALSVDNTGNAYISGYAASFDFPVTNGAFQTKRNGGGATYPTAFVAKLNTSGTALVYSTYLGGSVTDVANGIAIDGAGNAYIAGGASSPDFPVTQGAFQATNGAAGGGNAFVTKINPAGSALVYSTFLGGIGALLTDSASGLAVDDSGNAYITGGSSSTNFPVTPGAFQMTNQSTNKGSNAFVTELNSAGTALVYSTYLGGSRSDVANGIAIDGAGNAYIAGRTSSTDFPVTPGAFQTTNHSTNKDSNAFAAKLALGAPPPAPTITPGGIVAVDSTVTTIQPGEFVSIYGTNLGPAPPATWTGVFVTSLGGTSVTIDGNAAYLTYASPTQINLQAPNNTNTTTRSVPVVVTTRAGTTTSTVTLAQFAPSFLLFDSKHVTGIILRPDGSGSQGGGAYDLLGPTGNSLGFPTVAAKAGDSVELYAAGFGPTNPPIQAGQAFSGAAPTTNQVNLLTKNMNVIPSFAGFSSSLLYQINLTIPVGLGTGDVPLAATVGGMRTQSGVVISLQ